MLLAFENEQLRDTIIDTLQVGQEGAPDDEVIVHVVSIRKDEFNDSRLWLTLDNGAEYHLTLMKVRQEEV
jgi:hypothetical protein